MLKSFQSTFLVAQSSSSLLNTWKPLVPRFLNSLSCPFILLYLPKSSCVCSNLLPECGKWSLPLTSLKQVWQCPAYTMLLTLGFRNRTALIRVLAWTCWWSSRYHKHRYASGWVILGRLVPESATASSIYTKAVYRNEMLPTSIPDIQRTNPMYTILMLNAMGICWLPWNLIMHCRHLMIKDCWHAFRLGCKMADLV